MGERAGGGDPRGHQSSDDHRPHPQAERRFKEVIYKQSMLKHSLQEAKGRLRT